jgi:hypothetical protein
MLYLEFGSFYPNICSNTDCSDHELITEDDLKVLEYVLLIK